MCKKDGMSVWIEGQEGISLSEDVVQDMTYSFARGYYLFQDECTASSEIPAPRECLWLWNV